MRRLPPFALVLAAVLVVFLPWVGCAGERHESPSSASPSSVLLLSPDSLRADRLRFWDDTAPATPNVRRLAARGTVYTNAWATSPWTAPSMVSVMTGLYPPSHGVAYRDDTTPRELPTLPRILAARGYRLGNFSFFSQISYFRHLGLGEPVPGLRHATVAEGFGRWLAEVPEGEPFFAWVHLLETHLPYGATGYRAAEVQVEGSPGLEAAQLRATVPVGSVDFADGDREVLRRLYDQDVASMDHAVGQVLDALEAAGRLDDTLVVFVADHGEELFDHGWIGHASTSRQAKLVPEVLHVPLILAGPGVPAGRTEDTLVQQVDVLPSVLELLGLEAPEPLDGELLPGLFRGFFGDPGGREQVFFDSSPGGNLTPQEQRGERLQGVGDGRALYTVHVRPGRGDEVRTEPPDLPAASRERLAAALGTWRRDQAAQRLDLLARTAGEEPPDTALADTWPEAIEVLEPAAGSTLTWTETRGQIALEWRGRGTSYWLEYRLGEGLTRIRGSFRLDQQRVVFGPVPQGFWNDVAGYSPLAIRLVDAVHRERSPWLDFEVEPAPAEP